MRALIYSSVCAIALLYLAVANAQGYVPFAAPTTKTLDHSANHYHK